MELKLTLEQELSLINFERQAANLSEQQVKMLLVECYKQMLRQDAMYKQLVGIQWGLL